jgi:hypothetical protein
MATADEVQLQAALDYVAGDRNGTVLASAGGFATAAPITFTATHYGCRLVGQGMQSTILSRIAGGTHDIIDLGSAAAFTYHTELANLQLSGANTWTGGDPPTGVGVGLKIVQCDSVKLSNVMVNFFQDDIWVTTGTQYMLWDWVICQNFTQYGVKFDQVSGDPGHYLFNSVQVSIADDAENCHAIHFAAATSKFFEPIVWNDLSIWCPADAVVGSYGVYLTTAAAQASDVDNMTFNGGMFEGCYYGLYVGDTACRNIVFNGTVFEGLTRMFKGIVGSNYVGDVFLNNAYFKDITSGSAQAVDSGELGWVYLDGCKFYGNDLNISGTRYSASNCEDWVTENWGTATVASGQTHIDVTHGLITTPTRVIVSPTLLSDATHWWVTGKGATEFIINVDQDPGVGTATFDWHAKV